MSAATTSLSDHIWSVFRHCFSPSALLVVILFFYVFYVMYDVKFGPLCDIPGPFWYKVSGIPLAYMHARGKEAQMMPILHEKYGPVVRIAPKELSYNSGADAWEDIYGFEKAGSPKPFKDPIMAISNVDKHESIHLASDHNNPRHRRMMAPAFGDTALRAMQPVLTAWAIKMKDKIAERVGSQTLGGAARMEMTRLFHLTSFDLLCDLTFGEDLHMLDEGDFTPWVQTSIDGIKLDAWIRIAKHFKIGNVLVDALVGNKTARAKHWEHFEYCKDRVDKRLAHTPSRPDFWSFFLKKDEDQGGLSKGEQYVNAAMFMIAGTETTTTTLAGATFFLAKNPETLKTVREEVRSAFGSVEDMTIDRLAGLKYLNACLRETLRIYPPVSLLSPFSNSGKQPSAWRTLIEAGRRGFFQAPCALLRRTPAQGATICGRRIPGDVTVGCHIYSTHTSPTHFKDPLEFHPERWLGDAKYADDHFDAWAPFSVGPRDCLGKNLSWHESRLLLATLLMHFDFTLAEESQDWSRQRVFTLWERPPLLCDIQPVLPCVSAA
ncbi:cytochrome P450 [Colletotrichum sublineola]|nr:cytochrome P450 [Colletotrichum sublineola]